MNFLPELRLAGISYSISSSFAKVRETSAQARTTVRVKVHFPEGPPLEKQFSAAMGLNHNIIHLLVSILRPDARAGHLIRRWDEAQGDVVVKLNPALADHTGFSQAIHTALRKCASSPQSSISWNALHQLHRQDIQEFWQMVQVSVLAALENPQDGPEPTRKSVAEALSTAVLAFLDCRHMDRLMVGGREIKRTAAETFALHSFSSACKLTEGSEWMYGWLGFTLEDAAKPAPQDQVAATPAGS